MIGTPTPVTIRGVSYPSIQAAAKVLGISKQALSKRLERAARGLQNGHPVKGKPQKCGKCGKTPEPGQPSHNARTCKNA